MIAWIVVLGLGVCALGSWLAEPYRQLDWGEVEHG